MAETRRKREKFILGVFFLRASRLCFSLRSLRNLGRLDTIQLMHTKPFVYSYANEIFMVGIMNEPIRY